MAATNFTPISLYYSATAAAVPLAANLVAGELALNTADGKLYYKSSAGVVTLLAGATAGPAGGSNTQVQFNSSGALAGSANLTWSGTALAVTGTLSATGNTTIGAGSGSPQLKLSGAASSTANSGAQLAFAAAGTPYAYISNVAWIKGGGSTDNNLAYWTDTGLGHYFYANNNATTAVAAITSTGLAVTGTLSATGNATIGNAVAATNVQLTINGVVNKASRIAFAESSVNKWLIGNGAASENGNFEIYDNTSGNNFIFTRTGNLGIGASPNYKLQVNGSADIINAQGTTANAFYRATSLSAVGDFSWGVDDSAGVGGGNSFIIYDRKNSAYRFIINNSGNGGLGVTTITASGSRRVLQVSAGSAGGMLILGDSATENPNPRIFSANTYDLGLAAGVTTGKLLFYTNDVNNMTLDASSNLLVGTTSSSGLVSNNAYIVGGNFSTVYGSGSIATSATTVITLPTRDGANYLFSCQNISDAGTPSSYGATSIISQEGSVLAATAIQTASFTIIGVSGLNIQITSTLATKTYRWSLVRIL